MMLFSRNGLMTTIYILGSLGLSALPTPVMAQELETVKVKTVTVSKVRTVDASIEAVNQATVTAQTSGRIMEITVDIDDYVEKGQIIIRLRDKQQRSAYNAAKAQYDEAEAEYRRVKEVYEKKLVAKAELDRAEARLKSTKAQLEQAQEALEYTVVRAPYSGIVVKRHVQVGENARGGQKLMTGLSLEDLRAKVNLPQTIVHAVRKYKKAWVYVGEDLNQRVVAESLTISPFADEQSHTFLVRVNLPSGEYGVYPGMHTRVEFFVGEEQVLAIPETTVIQRSEVTAVYVKGDNGNILLRHIRLGRQLDDDLVEVISGLRADEQVVLDPVLATARIKKTQ